MSIGDNRIEIITSIDPIVKTVISKTGKLDEKTIAQIEELGTSNPTKQDKILKVWANEAYTLGKEHAGKEKSLSFITLSEKKIKELQIKLEKNRPIVLNMLTKAIENKLKDNIPSTDSVIKDSFFITVNNSGDEMNATKLFLQFPEFEDGILEYTWLEQENSLLNTHRFISPNLRGFNMGEWVEKILEEAARKLNLKKTYFRGRDTYSGITFPLNQGYTCKTVNDRKEAIKVLKEIINNPEKYNQKREYNNPHDPESTKFVYFEKIINKTT